jgi:hypothetical protein
MGQWARLQRLAILAGDRMVIVGEPHADPQQSLRLPNPGLAKLIDDHRR